MKHPAYHRALMRLVWIPYLPAAFWFTCIYFIYLDAFNYSLVRLLFSLIGISVIIFFVTYLLLWRKMARVRSRSRAPFEAEKGQNGEKSGKPETEPQ